MTYKREFYARSLYDALYFFIEEKAPIVKCSYEKADKVTGAFLLCNHDCTSFYDALTFYNKCDYTFKNLKSKEVIAQV